MSGADPTAFRRDYRFWLAVAAAIPVWWVLYVVTRPALNLTWPLDQPLLFIQLALLYPLLEEVVFRGAIQSAGHRWLPAVWFGPISLSNAATSTLFAALHLLYHAPPWALAVFVPSLLFGYFKDRYRALSAPVALHAYYNIGYYWLFPPGAPPA